MTSEETKTETKVNEERSANKPTRKASETQNAINEIWDEIGEINKAIDRIFNRLGLE